MSRRVVPIAMRRRSAHTTLPDMLNGLSRELVLGCLAYVHHRRARDEVLLGLLQSRLASLTAADARQHAAPDGNQLLNISEVTRVLNITRKAGYELTASGALPSVKVGVRRVRVRQRDLDQYVRSLREAS